MDLSGSKFPCVRRATAVIPQDTAAPECIVSTAAERATDDHSIALEPKPRKRSRRQSHDRIGRTAITKRPRTSQSSPQRVAYTPLTTANLMRLCEDEGLNLYRPKKKDSGLVWQYVVDQATAKHLVSPLSSTAVNPFSSAAESDSELSSTISTRKLHHIGVAVLSAAITVVAAAIREPQAPGAVDIQKAVTDIQDRFASTKPVNELLVCVKKLANPTEAAVWNVLSAPMKEAKVARWIADAGQKNAPSA